jgi:hypothetical protein
MMSLFILDYVHPIAKLPCAHSDHRNDKIDNRYLSGRAGRAVRLQRLRCEPQKSIGATVIPANISCAWKRSWTAFLALRQFFRVSDVGFFEKNHGRKQSGNWQFLRSDPI